MSYDLFVSYSREDNRQGRVTELVGRIQQDYREFAKEELQCFFDVSEVKAMDDWRHRILGGLRESNLLLLVLSPAYLASTYCEWEIVEFLKYENSRAVQGQGVAQIYFVNIPGLDEPGFDERSAAWVARVRRRNHVDLRPWYDEGAAALRQADVRTRFKELSGSLAGRLTRLRRIALAPGNLPAHNPRFVGRETEMERLHTAAGFGQFGVLTAVQGVGGMGKTALAIQYAYAYANFYPGGRWMIGCAGRSSLAAALRTLDSPLDIRFTDEEKIDDTRAAMRVLTVLQQRAESGAAARAGEKNPPAPRALLLLDNIDDPALLQPPHVDLISGRTWLHVIATTRLDPERIGRDGERYRHLPVDELPEEAALRLIESWQPQGRFPDEAEREAAREIVRLLHGFTLAVEVVAVHLGERSSRRAAGLLQRLKREGVDDIGRQTTSGVCHVEKLLSRTLAPTLETLNAAETRALTAAAILPPDSVPLPWLRAVVAEAHPETGRDAEPGYDDPWLTVVNHLVGLRLLQVVEWADDKRTPRICRVHRLIQGVTRERASGDLPPIKTGLMKLAESRADFLQKGWLEWGNRWEIKPLGAFAMLALDEDTSEAAGVADCAAHCMAALGDYRGAEPLYRRALEANERVLGPEHDDTLTSVNNLALLLASKGDYGSAESLYRRALEANERALGPEHLTTLVIVNNLAVLLDSKGDSRGADPLYRRALETRERVLGPEHRDTLASVNGLAALLQGKGDYGGAEPLFRRALAGLERILGPEHPDTLTIVRNLTVLLDLKGDHAGAEPLCRRALEAGERVLGPEHPDTLASVNSLAALLQRKGDYAGAAPLCRRVLEARERALGPEHPDTLVSVNNLAEVLRSKGDYAIAERLYRRALEANERVLGPEHPTTLMIVNNLADLLRNKDDYANAEPLCRRALEARERVLGWEHPSTLMSVNNLALLLASRGDYAGAESLYRRVLEAGERVLHPEHPDILSSVSNLAELLKSKGDYAGAEPLCRRALEARERVLGPEHPDTLSSVSNLAEWLMRNGDYAGAEPLSRRALETRERILGPEHSDTLKSVSNLADLLKSKGDYAGAEPLCRRALEARERILGPEHPDTLVCVNNLAELLREIGDYTSAEPLYRQALEASERIHGPEQSFTLVIVNNLAALLYSRDDLAGAEPLFQQALKARERALGPEHPSTLGSVNNLASLLVRKGDYAGAETLFRRALNGLLRLSAAMGGKNQNLEVCIQNYVVLMAKMGRSPKKVRKQLNAIARPYGVRLG